MGAQDFASVLFRYLLTSNLFPLIRDRICFTSSSLFSWCFSPLIPKKLASNVSLPLRKDPSIVQYSSGIKSLISFSRSMIRRSATDWTRPALKPFYFFHNIGLILYPTRRSRILLACWASTRSILIMRGCLNDSLIASFVISLNTTRQSEFRSKSRLCAKCHAIASPSLSGSAAR